MPLADGTRLGVSAILAPLGKGEGKGSGLVYRDTLARLSSQGRAEPTPRSCRACLPGSVQRRSRGTRESSLELVRYVVLNPVRARMYRQPRDHRWSSYSETAGLRGAADWLDVNWTLSQFGVQTSRARRRFREFVAEGRGVNYRPWAELSGQIYLGSVEFQERMTKSIAGAKPGAEIPARQRRPARPDLATVEREVLCAFGASPSVAGGAISPSGAKSVCAPGSSRRGRAARRHQFSNEAVVTAFGNDCSQRCGVRAEGSPVPTSRRRGGEATSLKPILMDPSLS